MDALADFSYVHRMRPLRLPGWLMPTALKAVHLNARLFHPMTMGVRAVLLDEKGWVYLVRHSYVPGWHCPGGGVEAGETVREALVREVAEEANIAVEGDPLLHGIYFNRRVSRRDHVVVFVVRQFRVLGPRVPDWEIVESGFFDAAALPEGTTRATRARLSEVLDGTPATADW